MPGVQRVIVFCIMIAVFPIILIITPLYLRYTIFADVVYPVTESDILVLQGGISSIFCNKMLLRMNSSFNAFQIKGAPTVTSKRKHIRLKKSMTLPDDTLEYWGFYLLKGALVKLKVCSRYEGARILVVRGEKNLETCGLMNHDFKKQNANMDIEYSKVKVTYKKSAEIIGLIDMYNTAKEDLTSAEKDKKLNLKKLGNDISTSEDRHKINNTKDKSHVTRRPRRIDILRNQLNTEEAQVRTKRQNASPINTHIMHGGNAYNNSFHNNTSASVSSFESDLFHCYDGKILLARGFVPSQWCTNVDYLDHSNRMVTEHLVSSDGYYYYIFYSDNDFVKNDIHAKFDIYKPTYRFSDTSTRECVNHTECEFPIYLLSNETIIVEVPTRNGIEHEADDITYLSSICNPRMGVYMIFPIIMLLLILLCAFL